MSTAETADTTPVATPRPATLTPQEEARAAELEAQIVAEEKAAEVATPRGRRRSAITEPNARAGISVRAADEYAYVARDVRRIAKVGGSLVALLLGLWVVTEVTGIARF
jgi:hypothetical protein